MDKSKLQQLPEMVLLDDEPVFSEPWEAQAFAMAVHLHQQGAFTWNEWAQALTEQIHSDDQRSYYQHWLTALETIVATKNLTSSDELAQRKQAWHDAAERTPHGDPILL